MTDYLCVTDRFTSVGFRAKGGVDGICRALVVFNLPGLTTKLIAYGSISEKNVIFEQEILGDDLSPHFVQFDVSSTPDAVLTVGSGRKDFTVKVF